MERIIKKILFIVPEWKTKSHIGNLRIQRYIKWFHNSDFHVTVISAGQVEGLAKTWYGEELTLRVPFSNIFRSSEKINIPILKRIFQSIDYRLDLYLNFPDYFILLNRVIIKKIKQYIDITDYKACLSTSPPESSHVLAYKISKEFSLKMIIDMRDGWLDEPLRPILSKPTFRRKKELKQESMVLKHSHFINVTSPEWKDKLLIRYPYLKDKINVLYNAYPNIEAQRVSKQGKNIELIYAGRFKGSSFRRSPHILFNPLLVYLESINDDVEIDLIGDYSSTEKEELGKYQNQASKVNSKIIISNAIPREELLKLLGEKDGFLLLSVSEAAVPSKLFEYLLFNKPILAFAPENSPICRFGKNMEQIVWVDLDKDYSQNKEQITHFFKMIKEKKKFKLPVEFMDEELEKQFTEIRTRFHLN